MSEGEQNRPDPTTAFGGFGESEIEESSGVVISEGESDGADASEAEPPDVRPPAFDGEIDRTPLAVRFEDGGQ